MFLRKGSFCILLSLMLLLVAIYAYADTIDAQSKNNEILLSNLLFVFCGLILIINIIYLCVNHRQLNKKNKDIEQLSKDDLTSLSAFRTFREEVQNILASSNKNQYEVISLDIKDFQTINSHYGIDKSLFLIGKMGDALKKAYNGKDVFLSREGAEIFVIFKRKNIGIKIQDAIENIIAPTLAEFHGKNYALDFSVGIYEVQKNDEEFETIIDFAHKARIKAKSTIGTGYEYFSQEMYAEHVSVLTIIDRMEEAFAEKEFQVVFQPRIDFRSQKINGIEALARWHPSLRHAAVFPDVFVPIMEKNKAIAQLDLYVFEEICRFINQYSKSYTLPRIAVNFSAHTLSNSSLIKNMISLLEKYEVDPSKIEIDLNEQVVDMFENTLSISVKILKKIGFHVTMDDFGTSFATINRLSLLDIDILKLDNNFLALHHGQAKGAIIVEEIIRLAKRLGMHIVAEGVETREQALWIQSLNCDSVQGFFFEKPMLEHDLLKLLAQEKNYTI